MSTKLMTIEQVADILACSPTTVRRLASNGELPRIRVGRRSVRFDPAAIAHYCQSRTGV